MTITESRTILFVPDWHRVVEFYETLVGLRRLKAWDGDAGPGIILEIGPWRTLEVFGPPPGETWQAPRGVTLALYVDDVAAWRDRLVEAGIPIARDLQDNPWGDRSFGVDDPVGTRVWFSQWIAEPEQTWE
jgi:catechol 2,3-dioxygenase-like lactoylglutathione lyase family enzyme